MSFSATIANILPEKNLEDTLKLYNPILNISLVIVIVNLGMPLDYRLIAVTTLNTIDTSLASIVSGTIVAAAIINEIIAVIVAKFAFKWAGEIKT